MSKSQGTIDLENERKKATFKVSELTTFVWGGEENVSRHLRLKKLLESDPVFNYEHKMGRYFGGRPEQFKRVCKIMDRLYTVRKEQKLSEADFEHLYSILAEDTPLHLQEMVFIPCLRALASDEQQKYFIEKAQRYQVIGCYAQTELSHGSNVAGLGTTATFIKETDEFEFNTPFPEACKWWVGQLGRLANYAVLFANMIIDGTNYGPHPFLIPIRSMETHLPFPGISIKDIGPKYGFNAVDNGTISFKNYRAPRTTLLGRYTQVTRDGDYIPPVNPKLLYGSMLAVRVGIVSGAYRILSVGSTIAVRYSCVRRQFGRDESQDLELQVMDYKIQQYRVLSMLASTFALFFVGQWMKTSFAQLNEEFAKGVFDFLPAMHAASSGLKGTCTNIAGHGLEQLRLACGGHGYSAFAGIGHLYTTSTHMQTAEGENYVLAQQTARHLLKCLQIVGKGGKLHPRDPANYLAAYIQPSAPKRCAVVDSRDWRDSAVQVDAYRHRAARSVIDVAAAMGKAAKDTGKSHSELFADFQIELVRIAHAHCMYIIVKSFADGVEKAKTTNPALYPVLKVLQDVFVLYSVDKESGDFTEDSFVNGKQILALRAELRTLLAELRPNAVSIVDSFSHSDVTLGSALGRYDGDVYNQLLLLKDRDPLNANEIADGIKEYILPHVHAKL